MADRLNRHRLLIATQVLSMLQSFALAALAFSGRITPGWLIMLSFVQGAINGVDMPTRQALVIAFVERREHLSNAIALNSSMFNLARLIGPAIGGILITGYGAGALCAVAWIRYAPALVSVLSVRWSS